MKAITDKVTNFVLFYYSDDCNFIFEPYLKIRSIIDPEKNNDVPFLFLHNCNIHESVPEIAWGFDVHIKIISSLLSFFPFLHMQKENYDTQRIKKAIDTI